MLLRRPCLFSSRLVNRTADYNDLMASPTRQEIVEALRHPFKLKCEVLEAYLFGSLARADAQAHSDVDVAVYLDPARPADSLFGEAAALAADLGRALQTDKLDVVILNDAPPLLYHRILRDGTRILSRDLRATTTREGRALSRYCDFASQLAKIDRVHGDRIDQGAFGK